MQTRGLNPWQTFFAACGLALATIAVPASSAENDVPVLIRFRDRPAPNDLECVVKYRGVVRRQFRIVPAVAATVPATSIAKIRREQGVVAVELDTVVQAHDIETVWGVKRIGCGPVHNGTFAVAQAVPIRGAGIRVAVLDTGIDYTHLQLAPNYFGGYDFVNNDSDPWDDNYHGTHVAGIIAAVKDGSKAVGVSPAADLYGVKVLDSNGAGYWSWVISGIDWCVNNNMDVVNLSLGSDIDPGSTAKAAFDNAYASGLLIVASAGNAGEGTNTVSYPARYDSVIAVGATTSLDERSSFSSTGPTVELAAPGTSIYSTYPGNRYALLSGTSMASPHVAGVAALVLNAGILDFNNNGRRNDDVRWLLQETAEDLGVAGRDNSFGFGLIDAEFGVVLAFDPDALREADPLSVFVAPSNLAASAANKRVTLTWLDNSDSEDGFDIVYGIKVHTKTTWHILANVGSNTTSHTTAALGDGRYLFAVRASRNIGLPAKTEWSNQPEIFIGAKRVWWQ